MKLRIEKAVLGCLMLDDTESQNILMDLNEKDFQDPFHRQIYNCMHKLMVKGMNIDCLLVLNELFNFYYGNDSLADSDKERIEISIYEMTTEVPSIKNIDSYLKALKEYREN